MCTEKGWNVPCHPLLQPGGNKGFCVHGRNSLQKPGWIFLESLSLAEQIRASQEDPHSLKVQLPSHEQPTILSPSTAQKQ